MRKLAWFLLILFAVVFVLMCLALWNEGIKNNLYSFFVEYLGVNIVNGIIGLSTGVMSWGSLGFVNALAVFVGSAIVGSLVGLGFAKAWAKRPAWMGNKVQLATPTMQTGPPPAPPQTIPQSTTTKKVEEQPEEVT